MSDGGEDSPGNSALGERSCYSHHMPLHDRWGVICGAEKTWGRNRCGKEGKRKVLVWVCETEDATRHLREDAKDAIGLSLRGAEER